MALQGSSRYVSRPDPFSQIFISSPSPATIRPLTFRVHQDSDRILSRLLPVKFWSSVADAGPEFNRRYWVSLRGFIYMYQISRWPSVRETRKYSKQTTTFHLPCDVYNCIYILTGYMQ